MLECEGLNARERAARGPYALMIRTSGERWEDLDMGTRGPSFFHRLLDISRREFSSVVPEFGVAGSRSAEGFLGEGPARPRLKRFGVRGRCLLSTTRSGISPLLTSWVECS